MSAVPYIPNAKGRAAAKNSTTLKRYGIILIGNARIGRRQTKIGRASCRERVF